MRHLGDGADIHAVIELTQRLAPWGLHLQVHFAPELVHALAAPLSCSAVPVVIDHIGRVDAPLGPGHRDFRALRALLADPRFRVKLSGIDRLAPPGDYAPGAVLARELLQAYPERCLWGTDWPHPNHHHVPDDARLVDLLAQIAPDAALREQLLVHNPQAFYRFAA